MRKIKIVFFNTIKTKMGVVVFFSSIIPLIIIGFISFYIARHSMEEAGLGQIKDTLEGGYSLIEEYYGKVTRGEISKKEAINTIKRLLSGEVKEIWFVLTSYDELKNLLSRLNIENEEWNYSEKEISYKQQKIADYNENKKMFIVKNPEWVKKIYNAFNNLEETQQYEIINSNFKFRIQYDFTKTAVIKIRDSGYVWAISGNPKNQFDGKAFEIFHPQIMGVNVLKKWLPILLIQLKWQTRQIKHQKI